MSDEANWNNLQRKPQQPVASNPRFDEVCAAIFTKADGKELLALLRSRYFDSPIGDTAGEPQLRARIVRQQFIRDLELARDRGLKPKPAAS